MSVDPYLGVDPRLAWMLKVLSDEFGMLGVLRAQQAAFDYLESRGAVDNRMRPDDGRPGAMDALEEHRAQPGLPVRLDDGPLAPFDGEDR